jgi:hypothetical protein
MLRFVRQTPLLRRSRRTNPSCGSHPLKRHKPADVVGKVLQADFGFRPDDADCPYDPTTRRGLLSTEHVLDASPNLGLLAVRGLAASIADDRGSRADECDCASRAPLASPRLPPSDTRSPRRRPQTCWLGSQAHRISGCHVRSRRSRRTAGSIQFADFRPRFSFRVREGA